MLGLPPPLSSPAPSGLPPEAGGPPGDAPSEAAPDPASAGGDTGSSPGGSSGGGAGGAPGSSSGGSAVGPSGTPGEAPDPSGSSGGAGAPGDDPGSGESPGDGGAGSGGPIPATTPSAVPADEPAVAPSSGGGGGGSGDGGTGGTSPGGSSGGGTGSAPGSSSGSPAGGPSGTSGEAPDPSGSTGGASAPGHDPGSGESPGDGGAGSGGPVPATTPRAVPADEPAVAPTGVGDDSGADGDDGTGSGGSNGGGTGGGTGDGSGGTGGGGNGDGGNGDGGGGTGGGDNGDGTDGNGPGPAGSSPSGTGPGSAGPAFPTVDAPPGTSESIGPLFAAPPPPLQPATSVVHACPVPAALPPDMQPPLLTILQPTLHLSLFSSYDPLQQVIVTDFETPDGVSIAQSGAEQLQQYLGSTEAARTLPFSAATHEYGPHEVVFTAADTAGNVAVRRTQRVFISLVSAACGENERSCESGGCSVGGLCFSGAIPGGFTAAMRPVSTYVPPVDTTPPIITMQGEPPEHTRALSGCAGEVVIETAVVVGTTYKDPGAAAFDDADGDLSPSVASIGLSLVDTSVPTPPGEPFVIRYAVVDSSGNVSSERRRLVFVVCPLGRKLCAADGGGYYCSVSAVICVAPQATVGPPERSPPSIVLNGPAVVEVPQGVPYGACNRRTPAAVACDRGATAVSAVDGDVSAAVHACREGFEFVRHGLRGCGIDTSAVGETQLEFFVQHGATRNAVARTLWIVPACTGGEELCADRSCSVGRLCPNGSGPRPAAEVNTAPDLELEPVTTDTGSDAVPVPRGWPYAACSAGSLSTPQRPCDTGVHPYPAMKKVGPCWTLTPCSLLCSSCLPSLRLLRCLVRVHGHLHGHMACNA